MKKLGTILILVMLVVASSFTPETSSFHEVKIDAFGVLLHVFTANYDV
mgnify:CR=1 FL=1